MDIHQLYRQKTGSLEAALNLIHSGDRICMAGDCNEAQIFAQNLHTIAPRVGHDLAGVVAQRPAGTGKAVDIGSDIAVPSLGIAGDQEVVLRQNRLVQLIGSGLLLVHGSGVGKLIAQLVDLGVVLEHVVHGAVRADDG